MGQLHASVVTPSRWVERLDSTSAASAAAGTNGVSMHWERKAHWKKRFTLGTAAWKLSPDAAFDPVTWNRAIIFTTPGRDADV